MSNSKIWSFFTKIWEFIYGKNYEVENLREFSRQNNLSKHRMYDLSSKRLNNYKGWTVKKYE